MPQMACGIDRRENKQEVIGRQYRPGCVHQGRNGRQIQNQAQGMVDAQRTAGRQRTPHKGKNKRHQNDKIDGFELKGLLGPYTQKEIQHQKQGQYPQTQKMYPGQTLLLDQFGQGLMSP